jgi:hypothetical protein
MIDRSRPATTMATMSPVSTRAAAASSASISGAVAAKDRSSNAMTASVCALKSP